MRYYAAIAAAVLLPSIALGQTTDTFYVNAGCTHNGTGSASSCAASGGAAGAFNDLESAVESKAADLTASNKIYRFEVEGSSSDSIDTIDPGSYTTDATRYIEIRCSGSYRTTGVWSTSLPRMSCSGYYGCIDASENIRVYGCQWESTRQSDGVGAFIYVRSPIASSTIHAEGNLARYNCASSCMNSRGVQVDNGGAVNNVTIRLVNNIIYNFNDYGLYYDVFDGTGWKLIVYNNTFADNVDGQVTLTADASSDSLYFKNNILAGTEGSNWTLSSSFGTAQQIITNVKETSGAVTGFTVGAVTFSNEGSDDFRLGSGDTVAKDAGTDLSTDAHSQYSFSTDIDGSTRSGSWDIGADEVAAAAGLPPAILSGEND